MSTIKIRIALSALALLVVSSIGSMPWYSLNQDLRKEQTNFGDHRGDRRSASVQLAEDASECVTPQGTCPVPPNTPKGAPCQCSSAAGTFYGVTR